MESRVHSPPHPVEAQIGRVLRAEEDARRAIEAAHEEAAARLLHARSQARLIAERAEGRILAVRRAVEERISERQSGIDREARRLREALSPADSAEGHLDRAIESVAATITGGNAP
jgi:vacuolar-type H+-ATPase subunit H